MISGLKRCKKRNFSLERYLIDIDNFKARQIFTKLRTSNHKLPIEAMRSMNIPRHNRKCNKCSSENIGDEFHILMECPNAEIQAIRDAIKIDIKTAIPQFFELSTREQFIYIMTGNDSYLNESLSVHLIKITKIIESEHH